MKPRPLLVALAGTLLGAGLVVAGFLRPDLVVAGRGGDAPAGVAGAEAVAQVTPTPAAPPAAEPAAPRSATPQPATPSPATPEPATTDPAPAPSATTDRVDKPELQARLDALLDDPSLAGADVALHVIDAAEREVFAHGADVPLLPASTVKLVTAAAALAELGPDHRFTTAVYATVEPGPDGVLHGDLVLVGGADPALATPRFAERVNPQRPRTPLASLADQLHAAGVRRVTGRVVGDPSTLPDEPVAAGWLDRYLERGDATRSSGLTVDAGRRLFHENGQLQSAPSGDPAAEAAAGLTSLLDERAVAVGGAPGATHAPPAAPHLLATVESPPLIDLLSYTVQRSDNHLADTLFRALGGASGDGTWSGSAAAVQAALAPLELDWGAVVLADGSGLSRDDRLTARFLTVLDARMQSSNRASAWRDVMAVSGRSGTLRRRLLGTVAEGRLAGKTGSLRDTRTLSGTVAGPDGTRYHFALLAGDLSRDAVAAARALQDAVVEALAEDLYGCERVPVETPSEPSGDDPTEPATELRCAA